jgi:hypothetical protein
LIHINARSRNPDQHRINSVTARFLQLGAAGLLFASGWLFRDPTSVPLWQIGLALLLAGVGVFWMYLHESWRRGKYIDAQFVPPRLPPAARLCFVR